MNNIAFETYSRIKSQIMFSLCVLFTGAILTMLGLVTGFLSFNGYKGVIARPGQVEGTLVRTSNTEIVVAPLDDSSRKEKEITFQAPDGTLIIGAPRQTLRRGMIVIVRYSSAEPTLATYIDASIQGKIVSVDKAGAITLQEADGSKSQFTIDATTPVVLGGKTDSLTGLTPGSLVQIRFNTTGGIDKINCPPARPEVPQSGLVPPLFVQDPDTDQLHVDYPGGLRNGIIGTTMLIFLASVVGIPTGMLTGIYLAEYSSGSFLATPVRFIADVLTGVPSIVVGILGYQLLVKPFRELHLSWGPSGFNGWAGALALAFIMIPLVARTTEEMLLLVPRSYREASVALGATKARTILRVVLPAAGGSLITGVMLAIARVAGETAPLLFTVLGLDKLEMNPNNQFPALTLQIYKNSMTADLQRNDLAWGGILTLLALIFVLNVIVRSTVKAMSGRKRS